MLPSTARRSRLDEYWLLIEDDLGLVFQNLNTAEASKAEEAAAELLRGHDDADVHVFFGRMVDSSRAVRIAQEG